MGCKQGTIEPKGWALGEETHGRIGEIEGGDASAVEHEYMQSLVGDPHAPMEAQLPQRLAARSQAADAQVRDSSAVLQAKSLPCSRTARKHKAAQSLTPLPRLLFRGCVLDPAALFSQDSACENSVAGSRTHSTDPREMR